LREIVMNFEIVAFERAGVPPRAHQPPLPDAPRPRSRAQRNRFTYYSPRNHRAVTVPDLLHLAIALTFELDATLVAYRERPGYLSLSALRQVAMAFWTRDHFGVERHYVFLPRPGNHGSSAGAMRPGDREALDAVAARDGLCLHYLLPEDNAPLAHWITVLELLAYLPAYATLVSRFAIREHLQAQLRASPRTTLAQRIERIPFPADSVRAVVAGMVHDGSARILGRAANLDTLKLRLRVVRPVQARREVAYGR
jgi:hypothetical protein